MIINFLFKPTLYMFIFLCTVVIGIVVGLGISASFGKPVWWPIKNITFETKNLGRLAPIQVTYSPTFYIPEKVITNSIFNLYRKDGLFNVNATKRGFNGSGPYISVDSLTSPATFHSRSISMANAFLSTFLPFNSLSNPSDLASVMKSLSEMPNVSSFKAVVIAYTSIIGAYKDVENALWGANSGMTEAMKECGIHQRG